MRRVSALVLLLALAATACGGARANQNEPAAFGDEVADGQFTFTPIDWECGSREVSRGIVSFESTGTYCILTVRVSNTGDAGRRFVASAQKVVDAAGRIHEVAQRETLLINEGQIGEELNPGLAIEVDLVWDLADPDEIDHAQLHDGPLSRGVAIDLTG